MRIKLTILQKTMIMIVVFALVLIALSTLLYARVIIKMTRDYYTSHAENVSETVAEIIDAGKVKSLRDQVMSIYEAADTVVLSEDWGSEEWNRYIEKFSAIQESVEFTELRDFIQKLQRANDVKCIYILFVDYDRKMCIYTVDGDFDDPCPPGCADPLIDVNYPLIDDYERGFPPYTSVTKEYGWLATSGSAIILDGEVVGYAMADISMEQVRKEQIANVTMLLGYLLATMVVISTIGIIVVKHTLVNPVKKLTNAAESYTKGTVANDNRVFSDLDIKTGDEIEQLADSMRLMELEINNNIAELIETNRQLVQSRSIAQEMSELANKDGLTGVRNKTSYDNKTAKFDRMIADGEKVEFGVAMFDLNYLKTINDTFGHDKGDAAIIKLCTIVCGVFVHSPVFRIGGDEFVAILQGNDYSHANELIDEFNRKLDSLASDNSLSAEDAISAAVGYARFDPSIDESYADVFKRADRAMYDRKREMKK